MSKGGAELGEAALDKLLRCGNDAVMRTAELAAKQEVARALSPGRGFPEAQSPSPRLSRGQVSPRRQFSRPEPVVVLTQRPASPLSLQEGPQRQSRGRIPVRFTSVASAARTSPQRPIGGIVPVLGIGSSRASVRTVSPGRTPPQPHSVLVAPTTPSLAARAMFADLGRDAADEPTAFSSLAQPASQRSSLAARACEVANDAAMTMPQRAAQAANRTANYAARLIPGQPAPQSIRPQFSMESTVQDTGNLPTGALSPRSTASESLSYPKREL